MILYPVSRGLFDLPRSVGKRTDLGRDLCSQGNDSPTYISTFVHSSFPVNDQ